MTKQDVESAIKTVEMLQRLAFNIHRVMDVIDCENIKKIKKSLEKQIPKKPFLECDGYADGELVYDTWRCPNCDSAYEVEYDDYKYCPNCGQAIDWRDVK